MKTMLGCAAGGGKAKALAVQTAGINPKGGKLMMARLDACDDKLAQAEAAVLAMPASSNEAVAEGQRKLMVNLGDKYMADKRYADSERMFREVFRRHPDSDGALYGLASLQQEQGKHHEALLTMEQVIAMKPRASARYRIGQSQQALGDKPYEKALAFKGECRRKCRRTRRTS